MWICYLARLVKTLPKLSKDVALPLCLQRSDVRSLVWCTAWYIVSHWCYARVRVWFSCVLRSAPLVWNYWVVYWRDISLFIWFYVVLRWQLSLSEGKGQICMLFLLLVVLLPCSGILRSPGVFVTVLVCSALVLACEPDADRQFISLESKLKRGFWRTRY